MNVNPRNEFLCVVQSHAFELSWTGGGVGGTADLPRILHSGELL